jgi:hypothetical protein
MHLIARKLVDHSPLLQRQSPGTAGACAAAVPGEAAEHPGATRRAGLVTRSRNFR